MENKKENYLFLYLNTGGGHLAPAKAVAHAINEKLPNVETVLVDGLNGSSGFKYVIEDGFRKLQGKAQVVFETLYFLNKFKPMAAWNINLVSIMTEKYIEKLIVEKNPSKIIVFHFFLIKPVIKSLKRLKKNIPVITVVTDPYSAPPIWFLNRKIDYVVFSDKVKNYVMSKKISPERIKVFPFTVNKKFNAAVSPERLEKIRKTLGIDENKKTILVMGGGDGMRKGDIIAKKFAESIKDVQIIVVCARSAKLFKKVSELSKTHKNIFPLGFVDYVHDLISLSHVVVTKCGASTFMEVLLTGKVPLINNYIWEQEKGNMEFVRDNNLGIFERDIDRLVAMAQKILDDEKFYNSFVNNIKKLNLENGTDKVADYIINY